MSGQQNVALSDERTDQRTGALRGRSLRASKSNREQRGQPHSLDVGLLQVFRSPSLQQQHALGPQQLDEQDADFRSSSLNAKQTLQPLFQTPG